MGKEYERGKNLSIGRSDAQLFFFGKKPRKEIGDGGGGDNVSRTFPAEECLQHFRTGNFTNETVYSWFLLQLNSPS